MTIIFSDKMSESIQKKKQIIKERELKKNQGISNCHID